MNTTIYLLVPTDYAHAMFLSRKGSSVPAFPTGSSSHYCHVNLEDAAREAGSFAARADFDDMAVIHITFPKAKHEELAYKGDLRRGADFNGCATWRISSEGAKILNESASCTLDIYPKT